MAESNKDIVERRGMEDWGDPSADRATGVDHGAIAPGKMVGKHWTGTLAELESGEGAEHIETSRRLEPSSVAAGIDTDRGNTQLAEWSEISEEAQSVFSPDQLSTIDDELQGVADLLGMQGVKQVNAVFDSLSPDVRTVALQVISLGSAEVGGLQGAHDMIMRNLDDAGKAEWMDALDEMPGAISENIRT